MGQIGIPWTFSRAGRLAIRAALLGAAKPTVKESLLANDVEIVRAERG